MSVADAREHDWRSGKITDEGIAYIRSQIGVKERVPAWNSTVTPDTIWHFALGVGDDNPLWWDEAYAANTHWGGIIAPPAYLFSHTSGPRLTPEQGKSPAERFLPGAMGLWGKEHWRWLRPVRPGERVFAEAAIVDVKVSETSSLGGRSVAHTERQELMTDAGEVVAVITRTLKRFEREQARSTGALLERPLARYTAEDRARFEAQYARETSMRRGGKARYVEDVAVGEAVGPILKGPLLLGNVIGFMLGAGNGLAPTNRMLQQFLELHPTVGIVHPDSGTADNYQATHFDPVLARAQGMPAGYDFGMQRFSWFTHLLTDWAGDDGFVTELDFRLRRPNFFNDVTWISGEVVSVDRDEGLVAIEMKGVNQLDEVTATATGAVRLPKRE